MKAGHILLGILLIGTIIIYSGVVTEGEESTSETHIRFVDIREKAGIDFEHYGERHRWCEIGPQVKGVATNEELEFVISPEGEELWKSRGRALTPEEFLHKHLIRMNGSGAAWLDYDKDGDWDIYLVNGQGGEHVTNALFENMGDGTFLPKTSECGVLDTGEGMAVSAADYNNDGYTDLFVTNYGNFILYRNNKDGTFTDVTKKSFPEGIKDIWYGGSAWGDYDRDGYLDLYVAGYVDLSKRPSNTNLRFPMDFEGVPNILYHNNRDGTFIDVTKKAHVEDAYRKTMQVVFSDFNEDGWADIFVGNDTDPNGLYLNRGDGTFKEFSGPSGLSTTDGTMGIAIGDYNRDLKNDIYFSNFAGEAGILNLCIDTESSNDGKVKNALFQSDFDSPVILKSTWPYVSWGAGFFDFENDGDLDLFIANGHLNAVSGDNRQLNLLFENDGTGHFRDISVPSGVQETGLRIHRSAIFADYDNDGKVDIYVVNNGEMAYDDESDRTGILFHNESGSEPNNWLKVRLEGRKSNRDAYGTTVKVTSGKTVQVQSLISGPGYFSAHAKELYFGLSQNKRVDKIEVTWPTGKVEVFKKIKPNQTVYIVEGGKLHENTLVLAGK
jgi:hypothetical protein